MNGDKLNELRAAVAQARSSAAASVRAAQASELADLKSATRDIVAARRASTLTLRQLNTSGGMTLAAAADVEDGVSESPNDYEVYALVVARLLPTTPTPAPAPAPPIVGQVPDLPLTQPAPTPVTPGDILTLGGILK